MDNNNYSGLNFLGNGTGSSSVLGQVNQAGRDLNNTTAPSWLMPNFGELQDQYSKVPAEYQNAIAPLRNAFNNTVSYNTSLGTQAANSAAQEYTARAAQSGATSSASGVVRAQSLLPVFQQNAQARSQEAGTEAQFQTQAVNLQANIANQLASLRNSYASTLANFITQRRSQDLSAAQLSLTANQTQQQQTAKTAPQGSGWLSANGQYINAGANPLAYENATNW